METPLVSVIIPNYNHARFLDERIQSVLNQTYQNFELIILDDKSTDNSMEVINKYKDDPHVSHIVVNVENSGSPFKQWHKGFELAKGEWIWIAESDDSCEPMFLSKMVKQLDEGVSFAFCRSMRIDEFGNEFHEYWQDDLTKSFIMSGNNFLYSYLWYKNIVWNASSALFNRKIALTIPKEYIKYRGAGDWMFWILLSACGNVIFINSILNFFRLHSDNTTQKSLFSGINQMEQCLIFNYLFKNNYIISCYFKKFREQEIKKIYFSSNLDKATKSVILKQWNIRIYEIILLKTKRLFQFLITKTNSK